MNKLFTKIAALALGATMATGVGVAVASNSKEVSPVEAASPCTLTTNALSGTSSDGNISWTAIKGSSGTAPAIYNNGIRLYQNGGFIQLQALNGNKITGFTAQNTGTYATTANYAVSESAFSTSSTPSNAGTNTSVSKSGTYTISNLNSTYVAIICRGSDKNSRFEISSISVTYAGSSIAVTGVSVSPTVASIGVGGTQQLTPTITPSNATDKAVTYSSSATGVATVNSTGLITAVAAGSATITVTTHDGGYTATCAVTVTAPVAVTGVTLNKNSTSIEVGSTETLTATVSPNDASDKAVTWSTSAPGVATVSGGVVTAVGVGTATITVTTHDGGYTVTCAVTVTAPQSVTFTAGIDTGSSGGQYASTISKSGISIAFSSCRNSDAPYRIYAGSTTTISSTIGDIAKIEFNMNGTYSSAELSCTSGGGTYVSSDSTHGVWTGTSSTIVFTAANQTRCDSIVVTLASNDPLVELDASSATSVSMLKGDSDSSVKVHVLNITSKTWTFTFDEDEEEGKSISSYISVSAGAAVSDVHTLTITTKAVGSTVMHISVSGTACATTIPVTVAAKPAVGTLVAKLESVVVSSAVECITGSYVQFTFEAEDTDGNPYSVNAAALKLTIQSGSSYGSARGTTGINGLAEGTVVARFALKVLETVYVDVTVNVVDDYIETVGTPTFATGLTDTQGESPTVAVFTSRPGTMHSGASTTIPFENYKFSYNTTYASAEYGSVFSYDFSHGTTVDTTHKLQTIYVFCDIDEAAHGSYTVTVEQFNDPLTAITITNVTDNAVNVTRGSSFQLEWAYTPTNPTDGKEVVFRIDTNDDDISITVSTEGLISIGASSNLGEALVVIESAHDDTIYDFVMVSAVLESMKYIVNEEESLTPSTTVAVGDRIIMVAVDKNSVNYELTGFSGTSTDYGVATSYTTSVSKDLILTVVDGNSSGTVAFKTSDNKYVAWVSGKNSITPKTTLDDYGSWTINGTTFQNKQDTTRYMYLNYNNGTPRFACYADKSSDTTGNYTVPTFLKITGGNVEYTVTEELFNAIHNNFGAGKTYEWSDSCPSFDDDAWTDACEVVLDLADYDDYKLNRAVANASGNEIEVFLAKYDFLVLKFGVNDYDYLGRFQSGGINYGAKIVNPMNVISQNTNSIVIVVIVSMVSVTCIGGYFFLRKRREQN